MFCYHYYYARRMWSVWSFAKQTAHHDILLHGDVYEGECSSVDKDVPYSEETTFDEVTQPDLSRCRSK